MTLIPAQPPTESERWQAIASQGIQIEHKLRKEIFILKSLNAELVAALEETQIRLNMFMTRSDITFLDALIRTVLAKVKEGE